MTTYQRLLLGTAGLGSFIGALFLMGPALQRGLATGQDYAACAVAVVLGILAGLILDEMDR